MLKFAVFQAALAFTEMSNAWVGVSQLEKWRYELPFP